MGEANRRGSLEFRTKLAIANKKGIPQNTCIICRKVKCSSDFNDEHVIPDSLNGYYHISTVCETCNSKMGKLVDSSLVNHKLADLYRWKEKIAGKSGKIPNPFSGNFEREDSNEIFKLVELKDGSIDFKQISNKPTITELENGKVQISLNFDLNTSEKDKWKVIKTLCKRYKLDEKSIQASEAQQTLMNDIPYKSQWVIDTQKFKLGLLKIAYEFAVDSIPEYFNDQVALEISRILDDADFDKLESIKMGSGLDFELFNKLEDFFDYDNKHVLWLMPIDGKLLCFIKLDTLFAMPLVLSNKPYIDFQDSIIGINDLKKRYFSLHSLKELLIKNESPTYTRFLYYFENTKEIEDYKKEIDGNGRCYIGENEGNPILYSRDGKITCRDFSKFLDTCKVEIKINNNSLVSHFHFNDIEEVFIKGSVTKKLYQVVGFEIDRKIHKV